MLKLKKAPHIETVRYINSQFKGVPYFPNLIANNIDFSAGEFYIIIPEDLPDSISFNYEVGGYVYPFQRNNNEPVIRTGNVADDILMSFIFDYVKSGVNCVCMEDFSWRPDSMKVREKMWPYYILKDRLFYLVDHELSESEIMHYIRTSSSWLTVGVFPDLSNNDIEYLKGTVYQTIDDKFIEAKLNNIKAFYLEVHDSETYLFWIKHQNKDILECLKRVWIVIE